MALQTYVPQDRLRALLRGASLPERASGAILFADISGFTAVTEVLTHSLGERRGIEEMSLRINAVYEVLIGEVERFDGSVMGFAGDAVTCWFDAPEPDAARRAVACAQVLQARLLDFPGLSVKVGVSSGPVRRLVVGHPGIQRIDVVAGATVARAPNAEHLAAAGEILVDHHTASALQAGTRESRRDDSGEVFHVLDPAWRSQEPQTRSPAATVEEPSAPPDAELLRPWVLPFVRQRESAGQGLFRTDLRPATALFIRFAGLDYDADPDAPQALDALVCQVQLVLQRHGGVLLELTIGDKGSYLYGSFGAAQVHEDDPCRALHAAVEIRQHFETLPYTVQMGLSSGTMRVGGYGSSTRQSFGAIGDEVNHAARLMSMAEPGEILVSARVRQAVADEFALEARPPIRVKGKAEPLPVFAVSGLDQRRAIRLHEPAYALPMVGREAEVGLLREALTAVLQGRGRVIAVTGEAGMGKSRLLAEGIRLARQSQLVGYGGSCPQQGLRTPYRVWRSIWSAFFDLDPTLPLRKQFRSIDAQLADRAPLHRDALPLLGPLLGLDLPDNSFTGALQPKDRKNLLETVLVTCLESAAREAAQDGHGLLLVLEDLHWIDPLSLDLLLLVARAIADLPVLVLLSLRPPEADSQLLPVARLQDLDHFSRIELQALNAEQSELAIRARLAQLFPARTGAVPQALIENLTQRAQGNPFYLEELLNYLHDRGIDPHQVAASDALDLPSSLHSLILSRIDRLAISQQLSLKVASVIGRLFRVSDLRGLQPSGDGADSLLDDLRELDRLDFTPLDSPEPELTYLFKHLVTLEVAYRSIAHATRTQLHGRFARYLEERYTGQLESRAVQLAHHCVQAGIHDRAAYYLRKAGDAAAAGFANHEALDYYARALELTPQSDTAARFDILLAREALHDLLGQRNQRLQHLRELAELAGVFADRAYRQALVATRRSQFEIDDGDYSAALSSARAAIEAIEDDQPAPAGKAAELLVDALLLEARAMFYTGQEVAARPRLERASALATGHGYLAGEYNALAQQGVLNWHVGDFDAAAQCWTRALPLIRRAGDVRREIHVLNNLGVIAKVRSRHADAVDCYEQAQRAARRIGDRSSEAILFNNLGSASLASGDFVAAGRYSDLAARIFAEVHEPAQHGVALTNRAEAYRELGQYPLATQSAQEALALLRSSGYRRGEAIALWNMGLIEFAQGRLEQALQTTSAAAAVANEIGSRSTEASARIHLGLIHSAAGRFAEARSELDAAGDLARELGEEPMLLEMQAAEARLALARDGPGDRTRAMAGLDSLLPLLQSAASGSPASFLSMGLYGVAIRALRACGDPRAAALAEHARTELLERAGRIDDAAVRQGFMDIAEHRAIALG